MMILILGLVDGSTYLGGLEDLVLDRDSPFGPDHPVAVVDQKHTDVLAVLDDLRSSSDVKVDLYIAAACYLETHHLCHRIPA